MCSRDGVLPNCFAVLRKYRDLTEDANCMFSMCGAAQPRSAEGCGNVLLSRQRHPNTTRTVNKTQPIMLLEFWILTPEA